jgi:hypothetical protein
MGEKIREKELEFDFRSALQVIRFDNEEQHGMSHCMKAVDFLVEWEDSFWFVEVKDPCHSHIPPQHQKAQRKEFIEKIKSEKLFSGELGPKLKDSFLYLHLEGRLPTKTMRYFVLLAIDSLGPEQLAPLSVPLQQASCIRAVNDSPWQESYIEAAAVFTEKTWNEKLAHCPVQRVS